MLDWRALSGRLRQAGRCCVAFIQIYNSASAHGALLTDVPHSAPKQKCGFHRFAHSWWNAQWGHPTASFLFTFFICYSILHKPWVSCDLEGLCHCSNKVQTYWIITDILCHFVEEGWKYLGQVKQTQRPKTWFQHFISKMALWFQQVEDNI